MILDRLRVTDRVVLITGGGRGIGAACAVAFAEAGAHVALTARSVDQLDETASRVEALGRDALVHPGDVNDLATLGAFVDAAKARFGRIDVVINNAGGTAPAPFLTLSAETIEQAFHFNVTTAFELSRLAVPHMLGRGAGAIVNVSSNMGHVRERGFLAYGTAKAALDHMTRMMAADLAPRIRVNAMACGAIATSALETVLTMDALRDEMIRRTPLKRIAEPEEVALCALYLASDAAAYITGKIIEIDGGTEGTTLDLNLPDL